ncbi:MAG TPA: fibronectin type III domain-containing protein, partial [Bryobacterales bacterium]|nr:fibronectin type III domain-containing protein [Bryobacterales bacterium]
MTLRMTQHNYAFFWLFYPGNRSGDANHPWRDYAYKGTWNPNFTRLLFTVTFGKDFVRDPDGRYVGQFGTYAPGHYYHYVDPNAYAGREMKIVVTQQPNHQVGQNSGIIYPYNPTKTGSLTTAPGTRNYWDSMTNAYFKLQGYQQVNDPSGQTVRYGPLKLEEVTGEPDAFINILTATWAGSLNGLNQAGYELTWWGPTKQTVKYEVRYSLSESIKTLGWSNATVGQTGITFNGGLWSGRIAQIPMSEQDQIWFGIRPYDIQIYGVSGNGQSPIWVTTRAALGLSPGDRISVTGVGGNTAANQTNVPIAAVRDYQVWRVIDGTLTDITASGGVCTVNLMPGQTHNLVPGWEIVVRGSENTSLGNQYSGTFYRVSAVVDADSFQFECPGVADGIYMNDHSTAIRFAVMAMPGVAIDGVGNGDWTGGGTLTPTGESNGFFEVMLVRSETGAPPAAPGMLNAAGVTATSVNLEWADQAANEDNYEVERKDGAQGTYARVAILPANTVTYTDEGLSPGATYYYRVRAVNVYGPSAYSNEVQVTTLPAGGIAAPSGPSADVVLNDQVRLSWGDNSTGESAYIVEVDSGAGFQDWASLPPDTTAYTVAGLSPSTAYTFR